MPDWRNRGRVSAIAIAAVVAASAPLEALDPGRAITQYVRESWIVRDGAPAGTINDITQTPNGYLWLGTEGDGLVRFDGVSFVRFDALDEVLGHRVDSVTSLLCGRDGTLWVGTHFGLARLKSDRWTAFDRGEAKFVYGLHESADGSIWYGRHWDGLFRVSGETLTRLTLPNKPRFTTSDSRGTLWVGGYDGLVRIAGEDQRVYTSRDGLKDPNVSHIYTDRDGNVWVAFQVGLTLVRDDKVVSHFTIRDGLSNDDVSTVYMDGDKSLWVGTVNGGLNRRRGNGFESLTKALGLSSNRVTAIYEDREGSLWVGTANGLNRLRDASFLPFGEAEGLSPRAALSLAEGMDGTVYVGSGFGGLQRFRDGRLTVIPPQSVAGSNFDGPLLADPDGGVWSGNRGGLVYHRGDGGTRYAVDKQVTCVSRDPQGILFADGNGQIYRLVSGRAEPYRLADGSLLGPEKPGFDYVWMMYYSRDATLWLATARGIHAVRDGRVRQVWRQGTLSARSISEDEDGTIWLATMAGVVRVAGESVATLTIREGLPQDDISFVVSDRRGGLWMSSSRGVFRAERRQVEEVAQGKAPRFAVEVFGASDGMRTSEATASYQPAGAVTRDGKIWFTTTEGVVMVDPARIRRNPLPPPVLVETVLADDRRLAGRPSLRVPAGTERLAIQYNGLSLFIPQQVRFKYKLEGYDRDWVDAEGRRVAFYTKLPPGDYRFRVIAANNDGVWNEQGASVSLRQLPHFYQTWWFGVLGAGLLFATATGAYRYRVRRHLRVERELQVRVQEATAQIKTLSGLLPICAWCKKVREDGGYWRQIETYVSAHSQAEFTHGICPECREGLARSAGLPPSGLTS